jgi:hypothetical protein
MSEPISDELVQRLVRLERENLRIRRTSRLAVGVAVVGAIAGIMALSFLPQVGLFRSRVVEAERFVVKDTRGKIRGILGIVDKALGRELLRQYPEILDRLSPQERDEAQREFDQAPTLGLSLLGEKGAPGIGLSSNENGSFLMLGQQVSLSALREQASLTIGNYTKGIKLTSSGSGDSSLTVGGSANSIFLTSSGDDRRSLITIGKTMQSSVSLAVSGEDADVSFVDRNGVPRLILNVREGKATIWKAP